MTGPGRMVMEPKLATATAMATALALALGACGGSDKQAQEPATPAAEEPDDDQPADEDVLIPGETLDAIRSFFERKNRMVSGCFTDALEADEIPKTAREVHVTLHLTITEDGTPTELSFSDATVASPTLERCLREHVERWVLPEVPKPLDYSYTFGFSAL